MGSKLFVRKIDEKAEWMPHHTVVRFPNGPDWETAGYRSLTWRQYADGINKVAHWLDDKFGKSSDNDTIAYIGPSDMRYCFIFSALNKTNHKFLIPDGRFVKDGLGSLLKATDCKVWLHAEGEAFQPESAISELGVATHKFPSLEWCLDAEGTPHYPYNKTYESSKHDEIVIIHTSGTTGPPKPIVMNNGFWAAGASSSALARRHWPKGISPDSFSGRSLILACPMRWFAGIIMVNNFAVFDNCVPILPPQDVIGLPADVFLKLLQLNYSVDGLLGFPFMVADLFNDERTREALKSLEFITYLGASLSRDVGDALCEHTRLGSVMGATESGGRYSFPPIDRRLWYTFQFIPEHHVRLVRQEGSGKSAGGSDDDDVYRLYIDRPPGGGPSVFQCAYWNFRMFKDVETIDVQELWKPLRDVDGSTRWEFAGRADDWVKLLWMSKFHAEEIEVKLAQYPGIKHVVVGGSERAAPYVLIEVDDDLLGRDPGSVLDEIYQKVIVGVNEDDAKQVGIPRETVLLAKKEKPIKLNVKGLVLRREVEIDYKEEIDAAYEHLERANANRTRSKFIEYTN